MLWCSHTPNPGWGYVLTHYPTTWRPSPDTPRLPAAPLMPARLPGTMGPGEVKVPGRGGLHCTGVTFANTIIKLKSPMRTSWSGNAFWCLNFLLRTRLWVLNCPWLSWASSTSVLESSEDLAAVGLPLFPSAGTGLFLLLAPFLAAVLRVHFHFQSGSQDSLCGCSCAEVLTYPSHLPSTRSTGLSQTFLLTSGDPFHILPKLLLLLNLLDVSEWALSYFRICKPCRSNVTTGRFLWLLPTMAFCIWL